MTTRTLPLKYALRSVTPGHVKIKGDVAQQEADGLLPGYSASGQDVWLRPQEAQFRGGGLILSAVGARCGKVFLADSARWGVVANTTVLVPQQGFDSRYLWYLVNDEHFWEKGGAAQPYIRVQETLQRRLPFPDLDEQRRIAAFLDAETARIDRLSILRQRQRDLLLERRAGALERLWLPLATMARGNPLDVPRAEDVPPQWDIKPLSELLQRITYGFTNPMPDSDHGPYLLTANDIGNGSVLYETARRTTESAFRSLLTDKSRPIRGDVLVTKDGSLGRVAEADGTRSCINQSVALLRPKSEYLDGSLVEALQVRAYNDALVFNAGGTTIKHLYITRMTKQKVALPNDSATRKELVQRSRHVRERFDNALDAISRSQDLLAERRLALITTAVIGQLDVTTARGTA